ncbi:hypothetical protein POTOM_035915 [Populus tomentosa]|uniref:THH1/TOM1/TOM3 domain-containing protein n=1 Tax=Populus tomentosa TaxID=118781 RepID=A0A8X7Z1S9_POPTO|nr:hypothetical protein POTOM_035915 [Populus tomentosa]
MDKGSSGAEMAGTVISFKLKEASSWWHDINESPFWQDRIFHVLAALYGLVAAVALIQLIRIQLRVPEYGWTTQKVFHFLNFLVNAVRCLLFVFRRNIESIHPPILQHILLDFPSLAFFTTYALLVLFWAEIYYQARAVSTDGLRPSFFTINAVVYAIQQESEAIMADFNFVGFVISTIISGHGYACDSFSYCKPSLASVLSAGFPLSENSELVKIAMWLVLAWKTIPTVAILSKVFFAGVSLFAALGFLLYGGRLFLMLQRFPVESKGRRKKLQEVGYVTTICFSCFLVRCIMMCFNAFDKAADLDVLDHPVLNFIYYLLVEILPSSLVLFILRKLPPKRGITQYHPIR